jgi:thiol-disulfide isomerase/thioredoxin
VPEPGGYNGLRVVSKGSLFLESFAGCHRIKPVSARSWSNAWTRPTLRFGPVVAIVVLVVIGGIAVLSQRSGGNDDATAAAASSEPVDTSSTSEAPSQSVTTSIEPLPVLGVADELVELDGWLQSEVASLEELHGKVVVVQFWTFGCYNCKNTIPHLQDLAAAHTGEPFEIVGVHAPEFDFEKDPVAIEEAARDLGVSWPIALDNGRANFWGWQGSPAYWPRTYVLDRNGNIRFDHIGEGAYDELALTVERLLSET